MDHNQHNMIKAIYRYFSNPVRLSVLNSIIILLSIGMNIYFQIFCIPASWMIAVLTVCFMNTIVYPFIGNTKWTPVTSFISGITLMIFIYCIIFLEQGNLIGMIAIIIGIGIPVFIPCFFVLQLTWRNLIRPTVKSSRYWFLTAICICTGIVFYIGHEYSQAISSMEKFKAGNFTKLEKTFMTEKILGMHFIYHTRFCEYDGWRPPKHDPALVIGMWLNNRYDPLDMTLEARLQLYRKFYPDRKYKFDCSCAIQYSMDYHNDYLWK